MVAVKKKMNNLKLTLEEAEEKAGKAERELSQANDRADSVSWRPSVVLFPYVTAVNIDNWCLNYMPKYFPCTRRVFLRDFRRISL